MEFINQDILEIFFFPGSEETKLDEVTMMLAIAIFVLHAPTKVVSAPNLLYPCINHFRQCLQSNNPMVCSFEI